jgi:squalene-associated FAD-dependent desaturase
MASQTGATDRGKSKIYVIGAGLAGLSAATALAGCGAPLTLIEAAGQAGGRCRSYFDPALGGVIDNGNHLVLSGNRAVRAFLKRIGAQGALVGPPRAEFPFVDLADGTHWSFRPNASPLPFWAFSGGRRVPGSRAANYAAYAGLLWPKPGRRVGDVVPTQGPVWDRLLHPVLLAALNTAPAEASATLAAAVLRESLAKGGRACRPRIAHPGLSAAFIDPALAWLEGRGVRVRLSARLKAMTFGPHAVAALELPDATIPVGAHDAVILAVPPWAAREMVPGLDAPDDFRSIVNAHFKTAAPAGAPPLLGVIGGTAEWIFAFGERISVTVSSADAILDREREVLARILWQDVAKALSIPLGADALPPWQIVKEKRATFAATPEQDAKRPAAATSWRNLFLAGDWTQTGLPATIEGALRSGETAAALARRRLIL